MSAQPLLDRIEPQTKLQLASKLTVFLVSLILSPVLGAYIYCFNLHWSGQTGRVFGTFVTILAATFLIRVPAFGFDWPDELAVGWLLICNAPIGLLLVGPLWKQHFSNIEYSVFVPWKLVVSMILILVAVTGYHFWLGMRTVSIWEPAPWYAWRFGTMMLLPSVVLLLIARFVYLVFRRITSR